MANRPRDKDPDVVYLKKEDITENNPLKTLEDFSNFPSLVYIDVMFTELESSTELHSATLHQISVQDAPALARVEAQRELPNLEFFFLDSTGITEMGNLSALTSLKRFAISDSP